MIGGTIIFAKMEPQVASLGILKRAIIEKDLSLVAKDKKLAVWLLRESRLSGCISADKLDYRVTSQGELEIADNVLSIRFNLLKKEDGTASWQVEHDQDKCKQWQKENKTLPIFMHHMNDEAKQSEINSLFQILEQNGLHLHNCVRPNHQQRSRNSGYVACSLAEYIDYKAVTTEDSDVLESLSKRLKEAKENLDNDNEDCPITFEPLRQKDCVGINISGHRFDKDALRDTVVLYGRDPLTNDAIGTNDILETKAPQKTRDAVENAENTLKRRFEVLNKKPS